MSVRLAAYTGKLGWENRYFDADDRQKVAIESIAKIAEFEGALESGLRPAIGLLSKLSQKRFELDQLILGKARLNDLKQARELLENLDYEAAILRESAQVEVFEKSLVSFDGYQVSTIKKLKVTTFLTVLVETISILLLWGIAFRVLQKNSAKLGEKNISLTTKIIETEEKLNLERAKNIQSEKLQMLGEMASGVAHEIKNPLSMIAMLAEKLQRLKMQESDVGEKVVEFAKKIAKSVSRIDKIVVSLQKFSRNASNDPLVLTSVNEIFEDTLELCHEKLVNSGITFRLVPVSADLKVSCRPVEMSQVLLNLLLNARDAIEPLSDKWIELAAEKVDDRIVIRVTDSGAGIPEKIAKNIFNPFYTTKPPGKGTGLGLSISKSIIESHGGGFEINRLCKNTQFVVKIPLI